MSDTDFKSVVVLTGAGVSAESGLQTFRGNNGLWEGERIEDVATPEAFARNPERVHRFYNARRAQLLAGAAPNAAHIALAEFEQKFHGRFTLITQNVDNLHELAGSQNLLHMHGELLKVRCTACLKVFNWRKDLDRHSACKICQRPSLLRPHIVWFGEMPLYLDEIDAALSTCDLFVSLGTSGNVYPAAGFVQTAAGYGAHTVELNLEPTDGHSLFTERHYGNASKLVPHYFQQLL